LDDVRLFMCVRGSAVVLAPTAQDLFDHLHPRPLPAQLLRHGVYQAGLTGTFSTQNGDTPHRSSRPGDTPMAEKIAGVEHTGCDTTQEYHGGQFGGRGQPRHQHQVPQSDWKGH
jgi:hypothetical protein